LTEQLIGQLGYVGIALILILGGLGLPIPEEVPIIVAAVLTRNGQMTAPLAIASCLVGVLLGDLVVYFMGFVYGEKVLSLPVTRRLLTRQREAQIKGYFHRHGFKILLSGRFMPGFRTAAYLTAGILKLPALKLLLIDLVAVSISTCFMFGLGFAFAYQIQKGIREVQQWVTISAALGVAIWLLYRYYGARRRALLPVGPPVLDSDDVPLPPDDLGTAFAGDTSAHGTSHDPGVPRADGAGFDADSLAAAVRAASDQGGGPVDAATRPQPAGASRALYDPGAVDVEAGRSSSRVQSPSR
jgi:membrane protein DedA with SNARE-associated domain